MASTDRPTTTTTDPAEAAPELLTVSEHEEEPADVPADPEPTAVLATSEPADSGRSDEPAGSGQGDGFADAGSHEEEALPALGSEPPEAPVGDTEPDPRPRSRTRRKAVPPPQAGEEPTTPSSSGPDPDVSEDPFELAARPAAVSLLFQAPQPVRPSFEPPRQPEEPVADLQEQPGEESGEQSSGEEERPGASSRRRRRGGKGRRSKTAEASADGADEGDDAGDDADSGDAAEDDSPDSSPRRRTRRRRRSGSAGGEDAAPGVITKVREPRREADGVVALRGSTRLEAKKQRRREGREAGRRRTVLTEAEYLARRESVARVMLVRRTDGRTQIAVLEDGVLVEHYVSRDANTSMAGNIYVGKVQNVLPSMEAAFVDIGKGRNAVLYAGEVNWDAAGLESGQAKRIENALEPGQSVLVQVTKDPIGHKGARLTSQVSLPGRYLVYVPDSSMTGISRKLPDVERARLKRILREVVPETAGVIVRTAAEGATEAELRADVERLTATWEQIRSQVESLGNARKGKGASTPAFLHGEPDLTVRVVRDIFNEDFASLVVSGDAAWQEVSDYVQAVAPDLAERLTQWTGEEDLFTSHRVDEQIAKAMDRKVWLPSGGSLVFDRTEAMTVVDVNTGKFVGSGGNLEETVTRNNIEAAEEIVHQLRLRDVGGIIVIDFIDMVLESNRDLVVRRLLECLGRDRTKHQVAEVTSLGLVQMTRKRVGAGLLEVFSEPCEHCSGRGYVVHDEPIDRAPRPDVDLDGRSSPPARRGRSAASAPTPPQPPPGGPTPAQIAAAAHAAAVKSADEAAPITASEVPNPGDDAPALDATATREAPLAPVEEEPQPPEDAPAPQPTTTLEQQPTVASEQQATVDPAIGGTGGSPEPGAFDGQPATPGRRRRGRVVAPAGPPRVEP